MVFLDFSEGMEGAELALFAACPSRGDLGKSH